MFRVRVCIALAGEAIESPFVIVRVKLSILLNVALRRTDSSLGGAANNCRRAEVLFASLAPRGVTYGPDKFALFSTESLSLVIRLSTLEFCVPFFVLLTLFPELLSSVLMICLGDCGMEPFTLTLIVIFGAGTNVGGTAADWADCCGRGDVTTTTVWPAAFGAFGAFGTVTSLICGSLFASFGTIDLDAMLLTGVRDAVIGIRDGVFDAAPLDGTYLDGVVICDRFRIGGRGRILLRVL